jgi:hypothetical protein
MIKPNSVLKFFVTVLMAVDLHPVGAEATLADANPVLVGAGDIASCFSTDDDAPASLIDGIVGTVFVAGDNVYENGSAAEYANCSQLRKTRRQARDR